MSGSPRRRRLRREEDISGQFRVTVPDAGELDQLRTGGEYIEGDCIPWEAGITCLLRGCSHCLLPPESPLQNPWTLMMRGGLLRKYTEEYSDKQVWAGLAQREM